MLIHASRYNPRKKILLSDIYQYSKLDPSNPKFNSDEGASVVIQDLDLVRADGKNYNCNQNNPLADEIRQKGTPWVKIEGEGRFIGGVLTKFAACTLCFSDTSKPTFDKKKFLEEFASSKEYRIFEVRDIDLLARKLGGKIFEMKYVSAVQKFENFSCFTDDGGMMLSSHFAPNPSELIRLTDEKLSYQAETRIMVFGRENLFYDDREILSSVFRFIRPTQIK